MKKIIAIILLAAFFVVLVGCNKNNSETKNNSSTETMLAESTYKAQAAIQAGGGENIPNTDFLAKDQDGQPEVLSDEDRAVNEEIAKYVETEVVFRANKQEVVNGKTFNLKFSKVKDYIPDGVIYSNDLGDTFEYDIKTGKLREAIMDSLITEKTVESIDKDTALKCAAEYAATKCDINNYTLTLDREDEEGYSFVYVRYIAGYRSTDRLSLSVGFDGKITHVGDTTDVFLGKNINYDKAFIDSKIKEHADESKVDWNSVKIYVEKETEKVWAKVKVEEIGAILEIPLE